MRSHFYKLSRWVILSAAKDHPQASLITLRNSVAQTPWVRSLTSFEIAARSVRHRALFTRCPCTDNDSPDVSGVVPVFNEHKRNPHSESELRAALTGLDTKYFCR